MTAYGNRLSLGCGSLPEPHGRYDGIVVAGMRRGIGLADYLVPRNFQVLNHDPVGMPGPVSVGHILVAQVPVERERYRVAVRICRRPGIDEPMLHEEVVRVSGVVNITEEVAGEYAPGP